MPRVIVFDVNETLLDLSALDAPFEDAFGKPGVRPQWFGQLLQSALVSIVTGAYTDFGTIGRAALDMVARRNSVEISAERVDAIMHTFRSLPPHPEARNALERLRASGLRLATLTNSTEAVATAQLSSAGLADLFERMFSADTVRRLKPAREPYEMAARELAVDITGMRMVAAHAWDIVGALRAGAAAAFVGRPGMVLDPLGPLPDVIGADLDEVADRILVAEKGG
jgi:2-haloacid dehalogenase